MLKKRFLLFTVHCLLSTALIGCTTIFNPATGKRETFFINTPTEIAIGKNVAKEVLKKYKVLDDAEVQNYIRAIGEKVASASERQDLQYSFTVLDSEELNAFALPGGGVYINKGLLDILDEGEIAACLGHELGHIAARHSVKRMQGQLGYQLLMAVAVYQVGKKDKKLAKNIAKGSSAIFELILLGYSRQDELLADKLAIKYTYKSGYSPWGMITSLKKLKQHSEKKRSWRPLVLFRSHPYLEDRIRVAEAEVGVLLD